MSPLISRAMQQHVSVPRVVYLARCTVQRRRARVPRPRGLNTVRDGRNTTVAALKGRHCWAWNLGDGSFPMHARYDFEGAKGGTIARIRIRGEADGLALETRRTGGVPIGQAQHLARPAGAR